MKKISILLLMILAFTLQKSYSQYVALQINLEIHTLKKGKECVRYSLYQNDSTSFLSIKNNPILDYNDYTTWLKRDADTILEIKNETFNKIADMAINLSPQRILNAANPKDIIISNDGITVDLEIVVNKDKVLYSIWSPMYNTKERNLQPFLAVCKEILSLAGLNSKKILK